MKKHKEWLKLIRYLSDRFADLNIKHHERCLKKFSSFSQDCSVYLQNTERYLKAMSRGWYKAAEKIRQRIQTDLNDFPFKTQQIRDNIKKTFCPPSDATLFSELCQIEQEFGQLTYDLEKMTLSVVTEPIVLQGVHLGCFEIKLNLGDIAKVYDIPTYRVIALEPNPAGSNENVTHPHVSEECLCEGDGLVPIRKALSEGRLSDFFDMVAAILSTYNSGSPYVPLNEWSGYPCYDCGYTISHDESYFCEQCQNDFCSECSSYCKICDTTTCLGCLSECPDCHEQVCKDCYGICRDCERRVCNDCLEDELCYVCIESRKDHEDEETTQTTTEHPIPTVQSDSMGQTRVSA